MACLTLIAFGLCLSQPCWYFTSILPAGVLMSGGHVYQGRLNEDTAHMPWQQPWGYLAIAQQPNFAPHMMVPQLWPSAATFPLAQSIGPWQPWPASMPGLPLHHAAIAGASLAPSGSSAPVSSHQQHGSSMNLGPFLMDMTAAHGHKRYSSRPTSPSPALHHKRSNGSGTDEEQEHHNNRQRGNTRYA